MEMYMMDLKKIKKALNDIVHNLKLRDPETAVEISGKWIHILIATKTFHGKSQRERENMVWSEFEKRLDDETLISITQCYLLTPKERAATLRKVS